MVLPAWSGQVTPADAARAPRLDMIPGETLMAGYAYNDSLSRHPNTLQRTVDQLQGLIVPETKTLGAQSLADKHFYRRKGLKHAAETLVAYQSVKAVGSQYETIQRTELVRKLVPQLGHDFMQIQKRDKAHADFQKLGRVREALDDLRTQLRAYDENSHIRSTLEKQEQMKKNSIFEMATLKRQWKFDMEQLEATYDQKDMAVINKYHNKLRLLQSELAGNTAPLGFEKTPKLNTRGLELKGRLDAFASLKAENAAAYAQAIVLQDDLVIFEEAAEKDFEAGQAAERRRKTQAVMKERDAELLKLHKRRVGARTKLEHSLRLRAELMAQRQKNYQKAVNHDFVVGMDSRVMQGVVPKRPLPLIPRHPEMVATADRLQRRPHTVVSSGKSKLPMLPSPFGATRPGTVQSGGSGYLPSRGTSRGTNSQHTPFNPRLIVS